MHSGQMVDPQNHFAKELNKFKGKRAKTESDLEMMSKIEFAAGLYKNSKNEIVLPVHVLDATLIAGAKKFKLGPQAKAGIFVESDSILEFRDKGQPDEFLYENGYIHRVNVKIGQAKIMRTRPIFEEWSATLNINFDETIIDKDEILKLISKAGEVVGLCDWRPRFGRFEIVEN